MSRTTPEFIAKRQKGKESISRNIDPHRLLCWGYDKLEQKMINEKRKQRELELGYPSRIFDHSPYPPSRHEKWKWTR